MIDIKLLFQILSTAVIIGVIILQKKQLQFSRKNIGYIAAYMFWMIHGLVFYLFVFLNNLDTFSIYELIPSNTWSSTLRFHGLSTVFFVEISRYKLLKLQYKEEGTKNGRNS